VAVWPGAGSCQLCWLVNCHVVPGVLSDGVRVTFHWPTGVTVSGKVNVTVQLLNAAVPAFVTDMSTWKNVPPVFEGVAVQLTPPELVLVLEDELLEELELLLDEELPPDDELLEELELLLDEVVLEVELLLEELDDELELLVLEEELLDELEDELELLELDELELPPSPLIVPAEAVSVTRSSRAPSSRLEIRSV
jgi:hypothetical protein